MIDNLVDSSQSETTAAVMGSDADQAIPSARKWNQIVLRIFLAFVIFGSGPGSGISCGDGMAQMALLPVK
jgi:hypothetical protein